jgi:hypothetical protein
VAEENVKFRGGHSKRLQHEMSSGELRVSIHNEVGARSRNSAGALV